MSALWQDTRYGLRTLAKAPGFTAAAVLTLALALGIGASTVGFSVFYNLMFNAFAAKDASRLAVPTVQDAQGYVVPLWRSVPDLGDFGDGSSSVHGGCAGVGDCRVGGVLDTGAKSDED